MTSLNEKVIKFMEQQVLFNHHIGLQVSKLDQGSCTMVLPFREEFIGDPFRPAMHGGVISTLIDTCGGAAVWSAAEVMDRVSTVDLRVDFLRPGPLEELTCEGKVLRMGHKVGVADMKVYATQAPERIIASGKGVYNVRRAD